jgi:hypothetical protein
MKTTVMYSSTALYLQYLKKKGEGDPLVEGGVGGELGQEDGRAPGVTAHGPT